jgi:hypothetical protein
MRTITLPLPVLGFVISTRAALAAGLALVFSERIPAQRRRAVGLWLIAVGAVSTVPAARWLSRANRSRSDAGVDVDRRLIGATRFARKGDDLL